MTAKLTEAGYRQTKVKLSDLERRLATLEARHDLAPAHRAEAVRSHREMIQQYLREIKLYEARHPAAAPSE
jgi:hypothetical protein